MSGDVKKAVRNFIADNFLTETERQALTDDTSLIGSGIIDSTGAMELVLFLEDRYGINLYETELTPDDLDSIGSITNLVKRRQTYPEVSS